MSKKIGSVGSFTGGAEPTPTVSVELYRQPGSMNDGDPTFKIVQEGPKGISSILLSPATMRNILRWYESE